MKKALMRFALLLGICFSCQAKAAVSLTFQENYHEVTYYLDPFTGEYSFTTKGGDPYCYLNALIADLQEDERILTFEYNCSTGLSTFQVYFGKPFAENRSKIYGNLAATNGWEKAEFNISKQREQFSWGVKGNMLRFDFGMSAGVTIKIRNIKIITGEDDKDLVKERKAERMTQYLATDYPENISKVTVEKSQIKIQGALTGTGNYYLVEFPPYANITEDSTFLFKKAITNQTFDFRFARHISPSGNGYDRLLSKWAIMKYVSGKYVLASHAHYADEVVPVSSPKPGKLDGKKGLGGFVLNSYTSDLDQLQIHSVTVNILLNAMFSLNKSRFSNNYAFTYEGKTYYANKSDFNQLDNTMKFLANRNIITSVILLFPTGIADQNFKQLTVHPENTGGYYSMPNMTTQEAANAYAAMIDFLAQRYNGGTHGRIHHWIMHNEVDYGSTWTNMGEQPINIFMDTYIKSMRLVYNVVRQYDQNASVLGSYTHDWTINGSDGLGYNPRNMLEQTVLYSKTEGDFRWGVAYHPYPQNLADPLFWKNDTQSTYSLDSKYCTFKNLEVINAWILDQQHFYQGTEKRILFLSENGTNSRNYTEEQLSYQAAGACWAWKKVKKLPGIDGIQWHNWIDNRDEGGLRIGLRYFPDEASNPGGPKPVWYVWQAAETAKEDSLFAPYLKVLQISNWDFIFDSKLSDLPKILRSKYTYSKNIGISRKGNTLINNTNSTAQIYDASGKSLAKFKDSYNVQPGFYFVRTKNGVRKYIFP